MIMSLPDSNARNGELPFQEKAEPARTGDAPRASELSPRVYSVRISASII